MKVKIVSIGNTLITDKGITYFWAVVDTLRGKRLNIKISKRFWNKVSISDIIEV
jgi:hypothetical protein